MSAQSQATQEYTRCLGCTVGWPDKGGEQHHRPEQGDRYVEQADEEEGWRGRGDEQRQRERTERQRREQHDGPHLALPRTEWEGPPVGPAKARTVGGDNAGAGPAEQAKVQRKQPRTEVRFRWRARERGQARDQPGDQQREGGDGEEQPQEARDAQERRQAAKRAHSQSLLAWGQSLRHPVSSHVTQCSMPSDIGTDLGREGSRGSIARRQPSMWPASRMCAY